MLTMQLMYAVSIAQTFCPPKAKAVGSDFLWRLLQQLQPDLHVFGHSHFAWDAHIEGEWDGQTD